MMPARTPASPADPIAPYLREFAREWNLMVCDVRWAMYGGTDSPQRRAAYVQRRLEETRRVAAHRPEHGALLAAIDAHLGVTRS